MTIIGKLRGGVLIRTKPSYYSATQAVQYLKRIDWREGDYTTEDIAEGRFPSNVDNLAVLVRRHYLSFCMDHTPMHYSAEHNLDVSPEAVFKRLVVEQVGGTYCYGHNGLMLGILRALGYRAYTSVARMHAGFYGFPGYHALGHMVIFVQLGESYAEDAAHTWLVDVAPGPPAPVLPMPLSDDPANVVPNATAGEENRLTRSFHPESSLVVPSSNSGYTADQAAQIWETQAVWQLEYRGGSGTPMPDFVALYQFLEEEFFSPDYAAMHYTKMFKPFEDVFWSDIVSARYVLADEDVKGPKQMKITERPMSKITLFRGIVKRRVGYRVLESVTLETEEDRIAALKIYFGILVEEKGIEFMKERAASMDNIERVDVLI